MEKWFSFKIADQLALAPVDTYGVHMSQLQRSDVTTAFSRNLTTPHLDLLHFALWIMGTPMYLAKSR